MWSGLSNEELEKKRQELDKKAAERAKNVATQAKEAWEKQVETATQKLCNSFREIYHDFLSYDNYGRYYTLVAIWKPFVTTILEENLSWWNTSDLFNKSKQALLDCCESGNEDEDTALKNLIKTITYDHIKHYCTDTEYGRVDLVVLAEEGRLAHLEENNTPQEAISLLQNDIALTEAKGYFEQLKKEAIVHRNFIRAREKLHTLLTIFTPTEEILSKFEAFKTYATFGSIDSVNEYFELLQKHCLTLLDAHDSTDSAYLAAYHLLYSAQYWLEGIDLKRSSEWVDLKAYENRVHTIQDALQTTPDKILLYQWNYFEEKKTTVAQLEQEQDATIKALNDFLEKAPLTYRNSRSALGKKIIETHTMLAEHLQSDLTKIMGTLENCFHYYPSIKSLFIALWQVCLSHYEKANLFSDAWTVSSRTLASLYQTTGQWAYAKKCYLDILEKYPDDALAKEALASLNAPAFEKKNVTVVTKKRQFPLSITLQRAFELAAEADVLREKFHQLCTCLDKLIACCPDTDDSLRQEALALSTAMREKYQAAKVLLKEITPQERKKFSQEIEVFSRYIDVKIATRLALRHIKEENFDPKIHTPQAISAIINDVQYDYKPFEHPTFRQYQYHALVDWVAVKDIIRVDDRKKKYRSIEKIYTALENFPEADHIDLANGLTETYQTLFKITEDDSDREKAIQYAQCAIIYCLDSQKDNVRDHFDVYVQRVAHLTGEPQVYNIRLQRLPFINLIDEIIQSPDFLALLLEKGHIWQEILGALRAYSYDNALVARFKKYHQDDALAFLVKTDKEIRREIQSTSITSSFDGSLETVNAHIDRLKSELKTQPYSMPIIYQLVHAYLQQRMILTKPDVQVSPAIIVQNMKNMVSLQAILWQSTPDLFCRVKIEQLNDTLFKWRSAIQEEKARKQSADHLIALTRTLRISLKAPLTQETLQVFSEDNKRIAPEFQAHQVNYWKDLKRLLAQSAQSIAKSDAITQRRFYHIMALCYKQRLCFTFNEFEEKEIREALIDCLEKAQTVNNRLMEQILLSEETRYYLDCIERNDTAELQEAVNASAEPYSAELQATYGTWLKSILPTIVVLGEDNPHFRAFKTGIKHILERKTIQALRFFLNITVFIEPISTTPEEFCQLYHDAYFILADATRCVLTELSRDLWIQPLSTANLIALFLWKECRTYYNAILKQEPRSPHYDAIKARVSDVCYHLGEALQYNEQWLAAKFAYGEALTHDGNHTPSQEALKIVEPHVTAPEAQPKSENTQKSALVKNCLLKDNKRQNGRQLKKESPDTVFEHHALGR